MKGREWGSGAVRGGGVAVGGDCVVGETPTIEPSEYFSSNSRHSHDRGWAETEGSYIGLDADGRRVFDGVIANAAGGGRIDMRRHANP